MSEKMAYFDVTGEFILYLMQLATALPVDTKLLRVEKPPSVHPYVGEPTNTVRFVVKSDEFRELAEGSMLPRLEVAPIDNFEYKVVTHNR